MREEFYLGALDLSDYLLCRKGIYFHFSPLPEDLSDNLRELLFINWRNIYIPFYTNLRQGYVYELRPEEKSPCLKITLFVNNGALCLIQETKPWNVGRWRGRLY